VTGDAPAPRPFPARRLAVTLVALAGALLLGDLLFRRVVVPRFAGGPAALSWWWMLPLAPPALVGLVSGSGLGSWRQLMAFSWAASALSVALDALLIAADPASPRAGAAAGASPAFWVVGLFVRWWLYSLVFGAGMLLGVLWRRRARVPAGAPR
jgi:hypothetical protein